MLIFRWRKFVYVMPTSVAAFLLALLVVEGCFLFFDKRKKNRGLHNSNDVRATFVGTIVIASLRGGDKYIEKAIEDVVDAEGYYEVIGYRFVDYLTRLLKCRSYKKIMIVTPGLLKAVEMFALHFPRSPVPFLPQVYVYRWQAILIQSVMWIILIAVVRVVAPATHRLFNNAVFVALMLTQTGGSCASLQKLPYANGIQTIERIKPRKQRILMHIGTSSDLEERIKIQVHGADKDRYFIGNKEVSTQEAARHIMAQSSLGPETETTKPILTTQNRKTGANLISANLRKIRDSGKKSLVIKQNKKYEYKYGPLSTRTKTLKDIKFGVNERDMHIAESFEVDVMLKANRKLLADE